ncbi:methyl-accepting chemotaxis protein [Paenibacillus roseipurpureus]|uniref:Methyl-accepting chemotaxis protein n=1 Tax=Paenibacillus roseopurpureus TaxID=2918901 RepID=A0AA96LPI0_9BACL|nr:methyl-accepting chemotaxis protein [Paenibacillus sp. MBLB1832]WNR44858.1 methyl-accepting chemotaxis protein [Paenibacillus sp. MBLB1832]
MERFIILIRWWKSIGSRGLKPGILLLNRLTFLGKFALIGIVVLVPLLVLTGQSVIDSRVSLSAVHKQMDGLEAVRTVGDLLRTLELHRTLQESARNNPSDVARSKAAEAKADIAIEMLGIYVAKEGEDQSLQEAWRDFVSQWDQLKTKGLELKRIESFDAHTVLSNQLSKLIDRLGMTSGLLLDSQPELFQIKDETIRQFPELLLHFDNFQLDTLMAVTLSTFGVNDKNKIAAGAETVQTEWAAIFQASSDTAQAVAHHGVKAGDEQTQEAVTRMLDEVKSKVIMPLKASLQVQDWQKLSGEVADRFYEQWSGRIDWIDQSLHKRAASENKIAILTQLICLLAVLASIYLFVALYRSITRAVLDMEKAALQLADGDLTVRFQISTKDEFRVVANSFNHICESFQSVLLEVSQSSNQLAASSQQLSASAEQSSKATEHIAGITERMADGANQQVYKVEESVQTIHEVSAKIQQIAVNAQSAQVTTTTASEKSSEGGRAIQTAIGQMSSISSSVDGLAQVIAQLAVTSKEISQITEAITEISQQTNLLSLNAAIEAARAGEHGRGFAVVADEVKKLAGQSAQSTEKIEGLIRTILAEIDKVQASTQSAVKEVNLGMEVVHTAGHLFSEIEQSVDEVNSQVRQVSAATLQISAGTTQVVQAIEGIASVAQAAASGTQNVSAAAEEQLASMQEISSSSSGLTHMADELLVLVDRFKM